MPPTIIQSIFINMDKHPLADSVVTISFPNGTRPNMDSLIHCKPNGIPTIVMHNIKPPKRDYQAYSHTLLIKYKVVHVCSVLY